MTELTWGQILNPDLNNALNRVMRQPVDYQTAFKILSISKELKSEQDKAQEMRSVIQDKLFDKIPDEKGEPILKPKAGKEEEVTKAQLDFTQTKYKLKSATIKSTELNGAKLSAMELLALEPLLADKA